MQQSILLKRRPKSRLSTGQVALGVGVGAWGCCSLQHAATRLPCSDHMLLLPRIVLLYRILAQPELSAKCPHDTLFQTLAYVTESKQHPAYGRA